MDWIAHLPPGGLALTANNRLAMRLRAGFDAAQTAAGATVWDTADILPYGAWLQRCWREAQQRGLAPAVERVLLRPAQERLLWEQVVGAHPAAARLLRPTGAAKTAAEAWRLLHEWALPEAELAGAAGEARIFAEWRAAFQARCRAGRWITGAELPAALAPLLASGALPLRGPVWWCGFDELTPAHHLLRDAWAQAGQAVQDQGTPEDPEAAAPGGAQRVSLPDQAAELEAAVRWARHWLDVEPESQVGIVVPDLAAVQAPLTRLLGELLSPQLRFPAWRAAPLPYNLSLGGSLADYDLVADALALLRLTPRAQPLEDWSRLLASPFVAGADAELAGRAALDARLRQRGDLQLRPATVRYEASRDGAAGPLAPRFAELLQTWDAAVRTLPARAVPSAWVEHIGTLLSAWGWGKGGEDGSRALDSVEHQVREKWEGLLEDFSTLDLVQGALPLAEAVSLLQRQAAETLFQPEAAEARVQVLGLLEAGGQQFDRLWVAGLHDEVWPPAPRPNPFLPLAVQRARDLPHATAERELRVARQTHARLLAAAPQVLFSHPASEGDRSLRPSPLLLPLPELAAELLPRSTVPFWAEVMVPDAGRAGDAAASATEGFVDWQGPSLPEGELAPGGSALFQDQSDCPFRAFARHRLGAAALEQPQPGLDPRQVGSLVHDILAQVWAELRTQADLLALDETALDALIADAVDAGLRPLADRRPDTLTPAWQALERRRLRPLIRSFLEQERTRAPFTVLEREQEVEVSSGGVVVRGRLDRVDAVSDGGARLLIDYKTGETAVRGWFGERPADPQLPLYASSGAVDYQGLLFARVRKGDVGYHGLAENEDWVPGVPAFEGFGVGRPKEPVGSRAEVMEIWRTRLAALGREFLQGEARVERRAPDVCTYCDLAGLCRIHELAPGPRDAADDGAGTDEEADNER